MTETRFGWVNKVRNTNNGKVYTISTVKDKRTGFWQTAVLEGPMGVRLFKGKIHKTDLFSGALNEEEARILHAGFSKIAETKRPEEFEVEKEKILDSLDNLG